MTDSKKNTILVIDDDKEILTVLSIYLRKFEYTVLTASHTDSALRVVEEAMPNLILLDIMMPNVGGFEVCRQIKSNEITQHIPIIFMTARTSTPDKVKGLEIGAVDYITKPFDNNELLARINTHLTVSNLQQDLKEQIAVRDNLIAELDAFAHTVAHDLKTPISTVVNYCQLLVELCESGVAEPEQTLKDVKEIEQHSLKAATIVSELLFLSSVRKQDVDLKPFDSHEIAELAIKRLSMLIDEHDAEIVPPEEWSVAKGHAPWVEELWVNYISNAIKYGGRPPRVELGSTRQDDGLIRFWVKDNGQGLTEEAQSSLFTEFSRLGEKAIEGHGLGLSIVRRIAEKLGGQVGVESQLGQGSTFYFTLSAAEANDSEPTESVEG